MCPIRIKEWYQGPGTFHACDNLARTNGAGLSVAFALRVAIGAGANDIILCGVDCEGTYKHLRAGVLSHIAEAKQDGVNIWRDEKCPFEALGPVWSN